MRDSDLFDDAFELDATFHALASPVRRYLIELLEPESAAAGDLAASAASMFGISASRVSQHLTVLDRAGLVVVETEGTWRYYDVERGSAAAAVEWLQRRGLASR